MSGAIYHPMHMVPPPAGFCIIGRAGSDVKTELRAAPRILPQRTRQRTLTRFDRLVDEARSPPALVERRTARRTYDTAPRSLSGLRASTLKLQLGLSGLRTLPTHTRTLIFGLARSTSPLHHFHAHGSCRRSLSMTTAIFFAEIIALERPCPGLPYVQAGSCRYASSLVVAWDHRGGRRTGCTLVFCCLATGSEPVCTRSRARFCFHFHLELRVSVAAQLPLPPLSSDLRKPSTAQYVRSHSQILVGGTGRLSSLAAEAALTASNSSGARLRDAWEVVTGSAALR